MMSYGDKEWAGWVLDKQEECDAHVKKAWEHGESRVGNTQFIRMY